MKTVIMDCIMDTRFNLQYNTVAEFKETLSSYCLQATSLCQLCDGWVLKTTWSEKLSDNYTTTV